MNFLVSSKVCDVLGIWKAFILLLLVKTMIFSINITTITIKYNVPVYVNMYFAAKVVNCFLSRFNDYVYAFKVCAFFAIVNEY